MKMQLQDEISQKSDVPAIDCLKLIMAISVVVAHMELFSEIHGSRNIFITWFCYLSLPFFFMASGYFTMRKLIHFQQAEVSRSLRNRSFKMFKLWVIWILIYLPLEVYNYFITGSSFIDNLPNIIHDLFLSGFLGCSWTLWFIYSLAIVFLILSFFKINKKNLYMIWLFFCLLEMSLYTVPYVPFNLNPDIYWFFNGIVVRILGGGLSITTGILLYLQRKCLSMIMAPVLLTISVVMFYSGVPFNSLFGGIALFIVGMTIKLRPHPIYHFIRNVSMWTYFMHMYVLYGVRWSISLFGCFSQVPPNYLTVGSLVVLLACGLSLLQRVKGFRWLGFLVS